MKYASIVPLIGGETIGLERAIGKPPEYLLSYTPFEANDSHLVNYYKKRGIAVPYIILDTGGKHPQWVDIVNAVCPCAGLSALSPFASADNHNNKWMIETAKYVMGEMKPTVFWGENAPQLSGKVGKPVLEELKSIGKANGYSMSLLMTSSILHGLGQTRTRSFYFFWKGDEVPVFPKIRRAHRDIDDIILKAKQIEGDPMSEPINPRRATSDPMYQFLLEEVEGGITHRQYFDKIETTANVMDRIEQAVKYDVVSKWMTERQHHKTAARCDRLYAKLETGGNVMRKCTEIPKKRINAFVGHMPHGLTHPHEDRYLSFREAMTIMGLPDDFELLGGRKSANHICQNVPARTAQDVAELVIDALNSKLPTVKVDYLLMDNRKEEVPVVKEYTAHESVFA